ncbi:phage tail protein I [Thalassotalea sp. G20_0]|uniref:phage tail protein I n=1 Tax=Thalassotalea sp. G20_0 TaxID=2821093 RepID=UPI001AD9A887|nr:phage tail protein I [Thalassotalea sp. G20_0]MBO9493848.1 phage tail protein I [Thalassotalea sp. G20_0]
MTEQILPPSATPQERALAAVSERFDRLPVPYRQLWNADECPVEFLPFLAYSFSVDQWDDSWPEHIKRQTVKDALYQHRIKGSRKAVEDAIAHFGTTAYITEWWQTTPKGEPHSFSVDISAQDNERQLPVYEISGQYFIYGSDPIPIRTSRVYRLKIKTRKIEGSGQFYAGVTVLDSAYQGINIGGYPRVHCAAKAVSVSPVDGWVTFEGEVSGIDITDNSFREGTVYVRPHFIVNYSGSGLAQVAEVELWDLFDNQQLISNPYFTEGKSGWSLQLEGESVPDNAPGTITTANFRPDSDLQNDIISAINQAKPLRSDFEVTVGTVQAAPLELQTHLQITVMHRGYWE